jgi:thioesterase III
MDIIVRSTEIDVNGHVNNAKYLEYLEWGREDWYEQHGLDYNTLKAANIVTVVVHVSADYRREAVQNDRLTITSWLERVGNTSFVMKQTIHNQHGDLVLEAEFVIVTVDPVTRQKVRVPDAIRRHALEP